jgi:hypothetical protein
LAKSALAIRAGWEIRILENEMKTYNVLDKIKKNED